jgi:hypothetical protein
MALRMRPYISLAEGTNGGACKYVAIAVAANDQLFGLEH